MNFSNKHPCDSCAWKCLFAVHLLHSTALAITGCHISCLGRMVGNAVLSEDWWSAWQRFDRPRQTCAFLLKLACFSALGGTLCGA